MGRRMWLARLPLEYIEKQDRSLPPQKKPQGLVPSLYFLQRNKINLRVRPEGPFLLLKYIITLSLILFLLLTVSLL